VNFMGYWRKDGQVGVRNHILVISTVECINPVTEQIARMTGTVPITHGYGCGQEEQDITATRGVLAKLAENPNVAAAFIVGLGCERIVAEKLAEEIKEKPVEFIEVER
jgi:altronate dehydratase large subunit